MPIYNLATREDHIAPAKSVFLGSKFFGGPVKFVLAGSGHIAGVVNPPGKEQVPVLDRRQAGRGTLDAWLDEGQGASRARGGRTGSTGSSRTTTTQVPAREPGGGKLKPIEDAPGSYVKVRAD